MTRRSYGTTAAETIPALPDELQENESEVVDESRALLGRAGEPQNKPDSKKDGHATLVSCISNLLNTIIGSGAHPCFLSRNAVRGFSNHGFRFYRHAYFSSGTYLAIFRATPSARVLIELICF